MNRSAYNGMAIAIAWPDYIGKQTGTWYDTPMRWLGFNKNYHYKVGHAALILADRNSGVCLYFDCGRYHTPFQHGRIRDAVTDENLTIRTRAKIAGDTITNFEEILNEIQQNRSCLGTGKLYAAYCPVDPDAALNKIKTIQAQGAVPFGPFVLNGTNCCRFVRTGILAGRPPLKFQLLLRYAWLFKPMPISNVNCLSHKTVIPDMVAGSMNRPASPPTLVYTRENIRDTLPAPPKAPNIPNDSQWLSGEVAGSWFHLEQTGQTFKITRYSREGAVECSGNFQLSGDKNFDIKTAYQFTHLSHCNRVAIRQKNEVLFFQRLEEAPKYARPVKTEATPAN